MEYTKEDIRHFKAIGIKKEDVERQLQYFEKGFDYISLAAPATHENGIKVIPAEEQSYLIDLYEKISHKADIVKMVPASGSATRMFKELFHFQETYKGSYEDFLKLGQEKEYNDMNGFFSHLTHFPFYDRLMHIMWKNGKNLNKMLEKRRYPEILEYILGEKGLNYGDMPKALIDFHIYRDFVRTALDEHLVEAALYARKEHEAYLHFTVSEKYIPLFKERLKKVTPIFEKMLNVKYKIGFSVQKPSTDTVSVCKKREIVRDENGDILFRPGGHGALIHNLNEIKADIVFIKNIDNVAPDRSKEDTVKYKKLIAGVLVETQSNVFEHLDRLSKRGVSEEDIQKTECFIEENLGYKKSPQCTFKNEKEHIQFLRNILDRPIRVCGMVKNEGEPGGGPFWVNEKDGAKKLMIIESAQVDMKNNEQKKIFESAAFFNPVDIVCSVRDHKGKHFDLTEFIDHEQGFITTKSYKGKEIKVQELPGLWNGSMAKWITVFVEVPLSTFTPVKTVFDLRRTEHANVFSQKEVNSEIEELNAL